MKKYLLIFLIIIYACGTNSPKSTSSADDKSSVKESPPVLAGKFIDEDIPESSGTFRALMDMAIDESGLYYVREYVRTVGDFDTKWIITKLHRENVNKRLWNRTLNFSPDRDYPIVITTDGTGFIYIAGITGEVRAALVAYWTVLKVASDGTSIAWSTTYMPMKREDAYIIYPPRAIMVDEKTEYIYVGGSIRSVKPEFTGAFWTIQKISAHNGNILWNKYYDFADTDNSLLYLFPWKNKIIAVGQETQNKPGGKKQVRIVAIAENNGSLIWEKTFELYASTSSINDVIIKDDFLYISTCFDLLKESCMGTKLYKFDLNTQKLMGAMYLKPDLFHGGVNNIAFYEKGILFASMDPREGYYGFRLARIDPDLKEVIWIEDYVVRKNENTVPIEMLYYDGKLYIGGYLQKPPPDPSYANFVVRLEWPKEEGK